jgi:hypothetical protein
MWRVSLTGIRELTEDPFYPVSWEQIHTEGKGLGRISHHRASVQSATEVLFYGGLLGDESNNRVVSFDCTNNLWTRVDMTNVSAQNSPMF